MFSYSFRIGGDLNHDGQLGTVIISRLDQADPEMSVLTARLRAWLVLSRPPFHLVGVLPFMLGVLTAFSLGGVFRPVITAWGVAGVISVMLATYYAGEYWDVEEDTAGHLYSRSRFAGGSGVIQEGALPLSHALYGSIASLAIALAIGVVLQFGYGTGRFTLPLGILGIIGGFFYSTRPVRWSTRGFGEVWIALCYGWLPLAAGYYLQAGTIPVIINWMAVPVGLTIFNVILLNEFPDYPADMVAGKRNLLVRLGPRRSSYVYAAAAISSWFAVAASVALAIPILAGFLYVPVLLLSATIVGSVLRGDWQDPDTLERICAGNLFVNLGTTAVYILAIGVFP